MQNFNFLGSNIEVNGACQNEIKRRLGLGRSAMIRLSTTWKKQDIKTSTKIRIVNAIGFLIVMYGSEAWTLRKAEGKKIDSSELWCWRRLLRISWTDKRTNMSAIDEINHYFH